VDENIDEREKLLLHEQSLEEKLEEGLVTYCYQSWNYSDVTYKNYLKIL
jgi:hypothetical protein